MKFSIWFEIKETSEDNWIISMSIHDATIYKDKFFIEGFPIEQYNEKNDIGNKQTIKFNSLLEKEIRKLLLNGKNYISTTKYKAWDYHHYLFHSGFKDFVHPISRSKDFLRDGFEGTQEEIYEICMKVYNNYLKK